MKEKEVKIDEAHSQVCSRGEKGGADEDRLDGIIKPKKKKKRRVCWRRDDDHQG